jgi:hypothetical protein
MSAYRQMTMPDERATAVMRTREFLIRLARSADGFVPDAVRMLAAADVPSTLHVPGVPTELRRARKPRRR